MNNVNLHIQENKQTQSNIYSERSIPLHIIVKLSQAKDRERIWKASKWTHHIQAIISKINS